MRDEVMLPDIPAVYGILCKPTETIYIGSARRLRTRLSQHRNSLCRGSHRNPHLQRAFVKYSEASFVFGVLELVNNLNFLRAREQCWINRDIRRLFNIHRDAFGPNGHKMSEDFKRATRQRMKGNTIRTGSTMPLSARKQISVSLKGNTRRSGIPHSEETKHRISASLKRAYKGGRPKVKPPNWTGRKHTDIARHKMSETRKRWWCEQRKTS